MYSSFPPKIVTANDLIGGEVVYLAADGQWMPQHHQAELLLDATRAAARLGFAETQQDKIVGAYLAEATAAANGPAPVHFRDKFRARGPSNHHHGKQMEQNNVSV